MFRVMSLLKKACYIVLIIFLVLSLGCTTKKYKDRYDENYRTGTRGIEMRFAKNSPPLRIYDDEELHVIVELRNKGATDVSGGNNRVYLSGFDSNIITGIPTTGVPIEDLEGKSIYNPEGELYTIVEFKGNIRDLGSRNIDALDQDLLVTACYEYKTILAEAVCIDPDPYSVSSEEKVCTPRDISTGSQGAPIAVTRVEVDAMTGKTRFKIWIKNVGGGLVFKPGFEYLDKCNPYSPYKLDYNDIDFVRVDDVKVGGISIKSTCKPLDNYGHIKLLPTRSSKGASRTGVGYMICELDGVSGPPYKTPITVVLSYNYRDSIQKRVRLLRKP